MMILGIDVGGSTTKIVGVEDGQIRSAQSIVAADPVTSLFGALGKYIYDNGIDLSDISRIMLTGVGSAYVDGNLYGLPTGKVEEFTANAIGAGHGSGLDRSTLEIKISADKQTRTLVISDNGIGMDKEEMQGGIAGTASGCHSIEFRQGRYCRTARGCRCRSHKYDIADCRKCGQFHIFGDRNQGFRTHRESVAASSVQISVRQDRQAVRPGFPYSGAYPLQNGAWRGIVCLER